MDTGVELQWGRGLLAAEIERHAQRIVMRLVSREMNLGRRASMGPRLVSRGNEAAPAFGTQQLQWGRGLLAAEMGQQYRIRSQIRFNGAAAC